MSTYNKTVWQDGDIITADKMNNIENGIYSYNEDITNLETNKQDVLTFDQTPTAESTNPVTSVGIKNAIEAAVDVTAPGIYETASGSIASFADGADDLPLKSCMVNIEPIQEGEGDPSPENVRPISGRTGVSVVRSGKNLLPPTIHDIAPGSGLIIQDSAYRSMYAHIPCGGTYTVSRDIVSGNRFRIYGLYNDPVPGPTTMLNISVSQDDVLSKTFTVPNDIKVILIYLANNGSEITSKVQLELGSTATDYEPYKGSTYSVNWQTEAGTVYGGTLDVVSGKLTVDRAMVDLGTLSWAKTGTSESHWRFYTAYNPVKLNGTLLSSQYMQITPSQQYIGAQGVATQVSGASTLVMVSDERYEDATAFKTAMNGVQLVYELATPTEIQLTPQEVRTLIGVNNIWSDAGDMAVEYPADTKMYIDQKITEAIAAALA